MMTVPPDVPLVFSDRITFVFSDNGRYAASLRASNEDLVLESWALASEEPTWRPVPGVAVTRETHALPLDDGRVLLLQAGTESTPGRHEIGLLEPLGRSDFCLQRLGVVPARGGYLLPSASSAQLGFVVAFDDPEHSTIWRLAGSPPPRVESVMRVPGLLSGGLWLDGDAGLLAVHQTSDSCRSSCIVVDLVDQSWRRIWSVSDTSTDRVVLYSPCSKLFIASTNASGEERLGWGLLGEETVRFPESLHRPGYVRKALALDDRGERLLVQELAGAVSRLFIYSPADDRLEPLASPSGVISSPASWAGDLIRFRFSAPCYPPTLATVRLGRQCRWTVSQDRELDSQPGWASAELIEFQGPAGPIEAIVYGGPAWQQCQYLVVALHGGPLSSWQFSFDPLFQSLAAAGIAVVAPNYRGSTGYGDQHLRAVIGNWGGPDLDDVLHLTRNLQKERARRQLPRPTVLGASYGGFLALLAACHEPELWSACVALAPFVSGPSLHKSAEITVRNRIEQLGGLQGIEDAKGPRDVLHLCGSLSAPLLLVHGTADERIPVEQSRMLRRRLSELGRIEGADLEYLEVDNDHMMVASAQSAALRHRVVSFCLARLGRESSRQISIPSGTDAVA